MLVCTTLPRGNSHMLGITVNCKAVGFMILPILKLYTLWHQRLNWRADQWVTALLSHMTEEPWKSGLSMLQVRLFTYMHSSAVLLKYIEHEERGCSYSFNSTVIVRRGSVLPKFKIKFLKPHCFLFEVQNHLWLCFMGVCEKREKKKIKKN